MKYILLSAILFTVKSLFAQEDSTTGSPPLNFVVLSSYAGVYYTYDFNKPRDNNRPGFIFSHNRHNDVNLNLGFLKVSYKQCTYPFIRKDFEQQRLYFPEGKRSIIK